MAKLRADHPVMAWLLEGDPAIRWQVMRDLLDEPAQTWLAEQRRTAETGWVAHLFALQGEEDGWPKGRWTEPREAPYSGTDRREIALPRTSSRHDTGPGGRDRRRQAFHSYWVVEGR